MNTETLSRPLNVTKRDGSVVPFKIERIIRAVALAAYEVKHGPQAVNRSRSSVEDRYGLDQETFSKCIVIADHAAADLCEHFPEGNPGVEDVQDSVELALLKDGDIGIIRRFIAYRQRHNDMRPMVHNDNGMQEYIGVSRYCRFDEKLGRREVWGEAVLRVLNMHLKRFAPKFVDESRVRQVVAGLLADGVITQESINDAGGFTSLESEITNAFGMVELKKVLPSMRSLQFGGKAIEAINDRIFNCAFTLANRVEVFRESFYLLLCGCGVGFSVQKVHVEQLPPLAPRGDFLELEVRHFTVPDTIQGWADACHFLITSYVEGFSAEFDYSKIRRRGATLKTSGGVAPGHQPLKKAFQLCEKILDKAAGRALRPIETYDILMHLACAVLSGGIRRSATICLFSADDDEMRDAKTGDWGKLNSQRRASNNSAVMIRGQVTREQFQALFESQKQFGEPGFYFANDPDHGSNPCVEIGLNPKLVVTQRELAKLNAYGYFKPDGKRAQVGDVLTGVQNCNLSTISGSAIESQNDFFRGCKGASVIGTIQADYTDTAYLGPVTRVLNEREALIGVSICGVLDNPKILLDPDTLRRGAAVVKTTNAVIAALLGINRAARTTCVKPEGTSSLVLAAGSGIHPHHARRYFRRVEAATNDPIYRHFKSINPHMTEKSVNRDGTDVISFPVEAREDALLKDDVSALRLLGYVKLVQENWVEPGRAYSTYSDNHHNVSNTINVLPEEWNDVAEFIWENRHAFTGVALLRADGDKVYAQSPREALSTKDDARKWNTLIYQPVDYRSVSEKEDHTAGVEHRGAAAACSGGTCELV